MIGAALFNGGSAPSKAGAFTDTKDWHLIEWEVSGGGLSSVKLDGVELIETISLSLDMTSGARIGREISGSSFLGAIKDVRLYDINDNPIAHWPLEVDFTDSVSDHDGTPIADAYINAASGSLTFSGDQDQAIDGAVTNGDVSFDRMLINKPAGTITLVDNVKCESLTGLRGLMNPNAKQVETVGNCEWLSQFGFDLARQCAEFDGSGDFITIDSAKDLMSMKSSHSGELWFKARSTSGRQVLLESNASDLIIDQFTVQIHDNTLIVCEYDGTYATRSIEFLD